MTWLVCLVVLLALAGPGCQVSDDDDVAASDDDDTAGDDDDDSAGPTGELVAISCGPVSVCVIDSQARAFCVYQDTTTWSRVPVDSCSEVQAGGLGSCTVDSAGVVACWDVDGAPYPIDFSTEPHFSLSGPCALREDTGVLDCWSGGGFIGAAPPSTQSLVGGGYACLRNAQSVRCISLDGISVQLDGAFTDMSGRYWPDQSFVCGLTAETGEIACEGTEEQPAGTGWAGIAGIAMTNCAYHTDGTVACWRQSNQTTTPMTPMRQICDSPQSSWFCGITLDNQVGCWGGVPDNLSQFEVP